MLIYPLPQSFCVRRILGFAILLSSFVRLLRSSSSSFFVVCFLRGLILSLSVSCTFCDCRRKKFRLARTTNILTFVCVHIAANMIAPTRYIIARNISNTLLKMLHTKYVSQSCIHIASSSQSVFVIKARRLSHSVALTPNYLFAHFILLYICFFLFVSFDSIVVFGFAYCGFDGFIIHLVAIRGRKTFRCLPSFSLVRPHCSSKMDILSSVQIFQ